MYKVSCTHVYRSIVKSLSGMLLISILLSCTSQRAQKLPSQGTPKSACNFPSTTAWVRLYIDDGTLATGHTEYVVTYQDDHIEEAIIFYSVSSPFIESVECKNRKLILITNEINAPSMELDLDWVTKELVQSPLTFYKSKLQSLQYASRVKGWPLIVIPTPASSP
jgi:hypothetical protein